MAIIEYHSTKIALQHYKYFSFSCIIIYEHIYIYAFGSAFKVYNLAVCVFELMLQEEHEPNDKHT